MDTADDPGGADTVEGGEVPPLFITGTPKLFLQLRKEIKKILATKDDVVVRHRDEEDEEEREHELALQQQQLYRAVAQALQSNLQTLIFDEVDRLLQTTTAIKRRQHKTTKPLAQQLLESLVYERKPRTSNPRLYSKYTTATTTPTGLRGNLQIVYASATIGRSLRKQLMYILQTASMDKAATLITGTDDLRTKKDDQKRKRSLLPSNLVHTYQFVRAATDRSSPDADANTSTNTSTDSSTAADDGNNNDRTNNKNKSTKEDDDLVMLKNLCTALRRQQQQKQQQLNPSSVASSSKSTSLVFPGSIGVEKVKEYLTDIGGFCDIRDLSSLRRVIGGPSQALDESEDNAEVEPIVYVIKERLARGIDLPNIETVMLLGVPSNSASYTHLAGRTARFNRKGKVVTLLQPNEIYKYISIIETLGLTVSNDDDSDDDDDENIDTASSSSLAGTLCIEASGNTLQIEDASASLDDDGDDTIAVQTTNVAEESWNLNTMTKTAIRSKTVTEIRTFLESKNIPTDGLLKNALVESVLLLKK